MCFFSAITRDRQWFLEIIFPEHILDRKRFKNEFFTIKNRILKKKRIKNGFSYEKIAAEKDGKRTKEHKEKASFLFLTSKNHRKID